MRIAALVLMIAVFLSGCVQQLETTQRDGTTIGSRSVSLSWSPPEQREDGTRLAESEIYAYELKYRKKGSAQFERILIESQDVHSGPVTHFSLTNLPSGEYEFLIATIDRDGLRSDFVAPKP